MFFSFDIQEKKNWWPFFLELMNSLTKSFILDVKFHGWKLSQDSLRVKSGVSKKTNYGPFQAFFLFRNKWSQCQFCIYRNLSVNFFIITFVLMCFWSFISEECLCLIHSQHFCIFHFTWWQIENKKEWALREFERRIGSVKCLFEL